MQRLLEVGLSVLLVATLGTPVKANSEGAQSANVQPVATQPTRTQVADTQSSQSEVEAKKLQPIQTEIEEQAVTTPLLERDRLILERRLQQVIPSEQ